MINWIKKANRSRNHFLKKHKLNIKLKMICISSLRYNVRRKKDTNNIKHIVLPFIKKGLGDAIVIGGIIDLLLKNNYQVSVIADKRTYFLFEGWENISNLYYYNHENDDALIKELKKDNNFIFIDSHEITHGSVETFSLMKAVKPAKTIGFHRKYSIYDCVVNLKNPLGHISTRYMDLLNFLGIKITMPYDYTICIPKKSKDEALNFIKMIKNKKIVTLVPYGSIKERAFSKEQINSLINYFKKYDKYLSVIIIGEQEKIREIEIRANVIKNTYPSFFTASQLIKESALIVTPDTSIVHLSRAFQKK